MNFMEQQMEDRHRYFSKKVSIHIFPRKKKSSGCKLVSHCLAQAAFTFSFKKYMNRIRWCIPAALRSVVSVPRQQVEHFSLKPQLHCHVQPCVWLCCSACSTAVNHINSLKGKHSTKVLLPICTHRNALFTRNSQFLIKWADFNGLITMEHKRVDDVFVFACRSI